MYLLGKIALFRRNTVFSVGSIAMVMRCRHHYVISANLARCHGSCSRQNVAEPCVLAQYVASGGATAIEQWRSMVSNAKILIYTLKIIILKS